MNNDYRLWAFKAQENMLEKKCSLRRCLAQLRKNTFTFSEESIDAQIDLAASMFGLTTDQVRGAIEEKEIWLFNL